MKHHFTKAIKLGLRIGLCLILLIYIFHKIFVDEARLKLNVDWGTLTRAQQWHAAWTIGPHELWHMMSSTSPTAFGAVLLVVLATIILGVIRWRMVLKTQGLELSFKRTVSISFVAQFFNSFLLGVSGGDLIKAYYVARETHHKKTEAVVTVFVDRLLGLWAMLFFACMMTLPNWNKLIHDKVLSTAVVVIWAMFVTLTIILYLAFWGGLSWWIPAARPLLRKLPKGEMIERSLDSCRQFGGHKLLLLRSVIVSLVINTLVVFSYGIQAAGMQLSIPLLSLFLVVPLVTCLASLPITIGGLGVRENLFVMLLAGHSVDKTIQTGVLSLSLMIFVSSLLWGIGGGFVYMGLKEKEHLAEVTQDESE